MSIVGQCYICGRPAMLTCRLCGRVVCRECTDKATGLCKACAAKAKRDQKPSRNNLLG